MWYCWAIIWQKWTFYIIFNEKHTFTRPMGYRARGKNYAHHHTNYAHLYWTVVQQIFEKRIIEPPGSRKTDTCTARHMWPFVHTLLQIYIKELKIAVLELRVYNFPIFNSPLYRYLVVQLTRFTCVRCTTVSCTNVRLYMCPLYKWRLYNWPLYNWFITTAHCTCVVQVCERRLGHHQ